ncbi:MAG TPA: hypothetical protein VE869_05770 [Gemmatimonas sp.]|nr:hypothetical protein [Gemmatimonas sp.]
MAEYIRAKDVHREFRRALKPWTTAEKFTRSAGEPMAWTRPLNEAQRLAFSFETDLYSRPPLGGSIHGYVSVSTAPTPPSRDTLHRSRMFTTCLLQEEISELEWIQSSINLRRPITELAKEWLDTSGDGFVQSYFQAVADPYLAGMSVTITYFSAEDVAELLAFILRVFPPVLARFVDDRCPPAIARFPQTSPPV